MTEQAAIYGLMAEFERPEALVEAARRTREAGFQRFEAHSPHPIEGLFEAAGIRRGVLPLLVLIGGLLGCAAGFFMQWYASVIDYPINVGGRPYNSWPAFIPITFELTILGASLTAVIGMLALNGLPLPYHPVFNVNRFALASRDRFFLVIEARDPRFDRAETARFLQSLGPQAVYEVPH
jgi:hypothetical protein